MIVLSIYSDSLLTTDPGISSLPALYHPAVAGVHRQVILLDTIRSPENMPSWPDRPQILI